MSTEDGFFEQSLSNGLRVVVEPMPHAHSAAGGFLVQTGSRDEVPELAGVSHFLEHMCFKGTAERGWQDITIAFDKMGSTYNAYTSKERTVYFGWVRVEDLENQLELLADMMKSTLPVEEFEMEKKVILEEIAMSDDSLERKVYDLVHNHVFSGHPLSWPVLGTGQTVGDLSCDQLRQYFTSRYTPANLTMIVAGDIEPEKVIDMAERICGHWTGDQRRPAREGPSPVISGNCHEVIERFQRQAIALIFSGPPATHPDRDHGDVLASILGGQNSRFYWNIIQAGIAPQVGAGRLDYCDSGIMLVYGFCEPEKSEKLVEAMHREIRSICEGGVTEEEVQRVKNRTRTVLATEAEAPYYRLMQMISDIDILGRPRSVPERSAAVDAVTPATIQDYLAAWPIAGDGALVSLGPRAWSV